MPKSTLDNFFPPTVVKPLKKDSGIYIEEKCSNPKCGKKIPFAEPLVRILTKGKEKPYCQACAKAILRPQENAENV